MKWIGITGGVGAGKSSVLAMLQQECKDCKVVLADELAAELMTPGHDCNVKLQKIEALSGCFDEAGFVIKERFAAAMYQDDALRQEINNIVHPAVMAEIQHQVEETRASHKISFFFFEAALLIECGYGKLCDEMWYIFSSEENRRIRLKKSRNYSDLKVDGIFAAQMQDDFYRGNCQRVIDNDGDFEVTREQIKEALADLSR